MRVLAVVSRFKWSHIDYLAAIGREVDLTVAWSDEAHAGATARATFEGLTCVPVGAIRQEGELEVRARLEHVIDRVQPDVVHVMYYNHERLTLMVREIVGRDRVVVWECRDPLTTLERASPGSVAWSSEAAAIEAADGHILVTEALRRYLEQSHGVDLSGALIVPHAFAERNAGPPSPKLSDADGRTHIALVGTADADPGHGRYYVDIIRRMVALGFVVHSHFHELDDVSLDAYARLEAELPDYHHHPTVVFRDAHKLSEVTSRYDLMGVFHELDAPLHNESATLEVCMPTKAVSAWLHGCIPVVTFPHYGGLVEQIRSKGIGMVVTDWDDLGRIVGDWPRIRAASAASVANRHEFSHEFHAPRIATYYRGLVAGLPGRRPETASSAVMDRTRVTS